MVYHVFNYESRPLIRRYLEGCQSDVRVYSTSASNVWGQIMEQKYYRSWFATLFFYSDGQTFNLNRHDHSNTHTLVQKYSVGAHSDADTMTDDHGRGATHK